MRRRTSYFSSEPASALTTFSLPSAESFQPRKGVLQELNEMLEEVARKVRLKPRKYQLIAAEQALKRKRAVIVMPTGTGKTLVGVMWAKYLLSKGLVRKVLVLEPTRIMVDQTSSYFSKIGGLEAQPIHGLLSRRVKEEGWKAKVVVTTPEEVLAHPEVIEEFDAVIVDECHHSVGEDAYKKVLDASPAEWRLGLSAHVPRRHRRVIEETIGDIIEWRASDELIAPYIPDWIGEIYETPLDPEGFALYRELEGRWMLSPGRERMLYALALRFLSRDGALALKESVRKETKLSKLLSPFWERIERLPDLHKLKWLRLAMEQHDFEKAIVFVDRVVVAKRLQYELAGFSPVLIIGRRGGSDSELRNALREARRPEHEVIVSTSAGEEGVDLPTADLLIIWSNVVSPLRFIQRLGRVLRKTKPVKYAVYLVTPDTVDMSAFLDSVEYARRAGVDVPISEELLGSLRKKTPRSFLLSVLDSPLPVDWIAEITGLTKSEAERSVRTFLRDGSLFYVYTKLGRTVAKPEHVHVLEEQYPEYFSPSDSVSARVTVRSSGGRKRTVEGGYREVLSALTEELRRGEIRGLTFVLREVKGFIEYVYTLRYDFLVRDEEVLEAVVRNAFSPDAYREFG